jgi:phosphate transport system permease protein
VLATARALGETIALAMLTGGVGFAPNPADGLIFLVEPSRPLPATILANGDGISFPTMKHTLFSIGAVLLFSALMLSLTGWAAKQPMKKYLNVGGAV